MSAGNSLLHDPRQLYSSTLPRVVSSDEDIGEAKVPADIVACENALHYRAPGHDLLKESGPELITAHAGSSNMIVLVFPLAQAFTPGLRVDVNS